MGCRLGPGLGWIDGIFLARHDIVVDAVLDVGGCARTAKDLLTVCVVFGEQQAWITIATQHETAKLGM
jgi:hypothetical protein